MADKIPVKAKYSGADVVALQEFEPTDTIALSLVSGFPAGVTSELGNNSITTLSDVFSSMSPTDGQVLTYDTTNGWQAETSPADQDTTDHTLLSNIGTNTHAQIDSHIGDNTLHFTQSAISITESQISDLQSYLLNITGESITDLSDVYSSMSPTDGQVLTYDTTNGWQAETLPAASVFGDAIQKSESLALTTSSNPAFATKVTLTTPSLPIGTYRISVSYYWEVSHKNAIFESQVLADTVQVGTNQSERPSNANDGSFITRTFYKTYVSATTHEFKLDFRTPTVGHFASIADAVIEIWRVS